MRLDDTRAVSAKRWVPPSTVRRNALSHESYKNDVTFRKVRGILNKLTPEKFKKLSDDILKLDLDSKDILKGVIILIFEKALDEPKYSSMYAQLCQRLCEEAPNFEPQDSSEPCTFRLLLLSSCKHQFESRPKRPKNEMDKRKSLGNIKFIGELCKLGVMSENILHKCMILLLKKCDIDEHAENLECLCQILRTCGRLLDHEKGKNLMNQYFERMESLMENEALPSRIRFMLQDTIELRNNNWVPRKSAKIEGPLPINQISNEGENGGPLRDRLPQQELFPRPLRTRNSGIDAMLTNGGIHYAPTDKFTSSYTSNGYGSGRGPTLKAPPLLYQPNLTSHYHQNRYNQHNNNNNNNNSNNVSNSKDSTTRFRRMHHEHMTTNVEEVSLRPPSNSMLLKQFNTKPMGQTINPLFKSGGGPGLLNEKPSPPIQSSKEMPIVIKPANTDKVKPSKKDKATSKEETLKKMNSIAEEIMNGGNIVEAVSNFAQLKVHDRLIPESILTLLSCTYEKTDNDRENMMTLLSELKKEGSIGGSHLSEAFREVVKTIPDKDGTERAEVVASIASLAVKFDLLPLELLGEITENGAYYPLLFSTLQRVHNIIGKEQLSKSFTESKVSLMSSLKESERRKERLREELEERNLVYLEPVLELESELWAALERDPSPQSLYKQARESLGLTGLPSPPFVTAIITVVIRFINQEANKDSSDKALQEKEKAILEKFKGVLQAFLHENINLQVTAVYALQMFSYYLDFPKGMLLRWFVYLYNLEIVEEEAFLKWREDDITDTYPGKGDALFQVNQWLNWLSTAEEEEDEEEPEN